MELADKVLAGTKLDTDLINQVLACAEKDFNINDILRYIVTINKENNKNEDLIQEIKNPQNRDKIKIFITYLYQCWIGLYTMALTNLTVKNCCMPDHQFLTINAIKVFLANNKFPEMGKRSLPDSCVAKINTDIEAAQPSIKPYDSDEAPQNNYILQKINEAFQNQFSLIQVTNDMKVKRIFDLHQLQAASSNFQHALRIIDEPLNNFLKTYKSSPSETVNQTSSSFEHSFSGKNNEKIDEYANLSLTDTVKKYIENRKAENKKYHFWGRLFAFTSKPFSVEDKENAINKIIYWKKRETNEMTDKATIVTTNFHHEILLQFTITV